MTVDEKKELVSTALKDYLYYREQSKTWQTADTSFEYHKGVMIGMLMALDLEYLETETEICAVYPSSKRVFCKVRKN